MASKTVRTPNSRLFATDGCDEADSSKSTPRRVKNYMKSTIFDEPMANGSNQSVSLSESDSGSETASNDGDRQPIIAISRASPQPPTTPIAMDNKPLKNRVPPGGYSSKLW